jgi:hypothetical protein
MNQNQNERVDIFVTWCISTKAGLGYLEALEFPMQILLLRQLASVRTVNSQWGENGSRIQFL